MMMMENSGALVVGPAISTPSLPTTTEHITFLPCFGLDLSFCCCALLPLLVFLTLFISESYSSSSSFCSGMWSSSAKKKKKRLRRIKPQPTEEEEEELIPSLPYDVALNCLARVPCSQHPTLSLVSKPIHTLLSSSHFFSARSLFHATQHSLYLPICIGNQNSWDSQPSILSISLNHTHQPTTRSLLPIPSPKTNSSYVLLAYNIYVIGGRLPCHTASPEVWVLDCRTNSWRQGPTMLEARHGPCVTVLHGKIYVMGGCYSMDNYIFIEMLDPAVGCWKKVVFPFDYSCLCMPTCQAMGGKVYAVVDGKKSNDAGYAYNPPPCASWETVEKNKLPWLDGTKRNKVLLGGVYYTFDPFDGWIKGLDVAKGGAGSWKPVKGLEHVPQHAYASLKLLVVCGNLFMVWSPYVENQDQKHREIWCSQIKLHKKKEELWGTYCWSHKIHTLPATHSYMPCLPCFGVYF